MAKQRSVTRPRPKSVWELRHADRAAEKGWADLCAVQPGPCRELFDRLERDPRSIDNPARQHRLRGALGEVVIGGVRFEQWQYELAKGARVWYVVDSRKRVVLLTRCATAHPNETK